MYQDFNGFAEMIGRVALKVTGYRDNGRLGYEEVGSMVVLGLNADNAVAIAKAKGLNGVAFKAEADKGLIIAK